jgi:poly-gamma-glutamate capsule biosynthesis protein CapA/YwtB (metallophosphatase superfamily)
MRRHNGFLAASALAAAVTGYAYRSVGGGRIPSLALQAGARGIPQLTHMVEGPEGG